MKRLAVVALFACLSVRPADANPYLIYTGAILGAELFAEYGLPVLAATGYGLSHTPSIHIFGTEKRTVGLDWGSLANRSRNVYGIQLSLWGGGFSEDLFGVQMGILTSGWVDEYDVSHCRMNGLQFAPFAVKTSTVNGFQICPFYATARIVNGFQCGGIYSSAGKVRGIQCGIVNVARRVDGLQIGVYNTTVRGYCLQLGIVNVVGRRNCRFLPLVNVSFR